VHESALAVSSTPRGTRSRWGALLLAVAGVLFLLYPAVRPWHDESTVEGATRAMSSGAWVAAHLFAMVGSTLVALGLLAVWNAVSRTRADRLALAAVVIVWIGVGLTLPYFGAEDFGLNAIARKAAEGQVADLLGLVDAVRFSPVPATTFAVGLLLLGAGAVLAALAIWRSGVLPRSSGILFAAGFVLFLPQFFMPPAVRIAHGVLVAAGSIWLALALWRAGSESTWPRPFPAVPARTLGYIAAGWCLGFAGVSAWLIVADPIGHSEAGQRYAADASGLAIMSVLVLVLKLAGAAVALAAVLVRPGGPRRPRQLLGVALWGAFGLLGLYSAGNLAITIGTVSGLLAPSAAWTAAGGVTPKAVGYVLFFLTGAALFGVLAVWFYRRHHLRWTSAVAGLAGAPLVLALLLAAAPAFLGQWGLLPT
jgi:succinate dehydrogenase hydrophobic anchor subunit